MTEFETEMRGAVVAACQRHGIDAATSAVVAADAVRNLCARIGGGSSYIPSMAGKERREAAVAAVAEGKTIKQAAREAGINERTVARALKKRPPESFGPPEWEL